jgi:hypothetical protein
MILYKLFRYWCFGTNKSSSINSSSRKFYLSIDWCGLQISPSCSTVLSANVTVTINALPTITSGYSITSLICPTIPTTLTANGVTGDGITVTCGLELVELN